MRFQTIAMLLDGYEDPPHYFIFEMKPRLLHTPPNLHANLLGLTTHSFRPARFQLGNVHAR